MKYALLILLTTSLVSCIGDQSKLKISGIKSTSKSTTASVSAIQVINNQLVITGNGLSDITNVKIDGTSFSENFSIESTTATKIIANSSRAFSFDISKVFNVILSDANASATFQIDFSLCNATLNGKGFDCGATIADKDVLSYDAVSGKWKPRAITGLNYIGTFNASTNPATGPATQPAGSYYIISFGGTIASISFSAGDWLVSNGTSWQKVENSSGVVSVFGRSGAITAQTGDYDLSMLGDISFPTAPVAGKVLKFDGTHWVAADDLTGGGSGVVNTADITDGAVTDVKIASLATSKLTGTISSAQITDGTIVNADINASAAIAYSKLSIPNGSIPYAKLVVANGDIPASAISGLPSATSVLSTSITDGDTTHAPNSDVVFDTFATKLDKTGGTITTILNVPTPVLNTEATTKLYVDTADNLKANKAGDTFSGVLSLDNDLRVKGGSNYVTVKGSATSAAYTLTLPVNAGSANQVLTTNGSGVLSWTTPSGSVSSLDASNVSTGVVSNAEFDYLDGVTSSIQAQLNAKEGSLPTGGTALQYFAGNKTLQTLNTAAVPESGSNYYFTDARVRAATLTGLSATSGSVAATDTVLGAFGKLLTTQGDYVSKSGNSTILGQVTIDATTGVLNVPTPASLTQATSRGWVENLVDTYGHWAKSGSNISFSGGKVGIGTSSPSYPLSVNGVIESTTGGVRFPDGSVQLSAAKWTTTSSTGQSTVLSSGTYAPAGQLGTQLTVPGNGSVDDGYYTINLPFPVNFNGNMYSTLYVGTNSYVTFGSGSSAYNSLSAAMPGANKIMIYAADRSSNSVWFDSTSTTFSIRYEGGCSTSPGTAMIWELSGSSTNDKLLKLNVLSLCTGGYSTIANVTTELQAFMPGAPAAYEIEYKSVTVASALNYMAGNVGIGTSNPGAALEVAGQVKITGGVPGSGKVLTSDASGLATWETPSIVGDNLGNHTATQNIQLGSHYLSGDGGNEGISVDSSGKVIIGAQETTDASLTVKGSAWGNYSNNSTTSYYPFNDLGGVSSYVEIANTSTGFSSPGAFLGLKSAAMSSTPLQRAYIGILANVGSSNYTPTIILGQQTGATAYRERMRIDADGNVGIGTTTTTEKFNVDNGTTRGTYTTGGWMHSSDRRLKHDISPLEDSLDKILKLTGVEYIFNKDPDNKKQIGFIAQDVEPIFPEVVATDKNGFKSMVYSNLIAPLVESVKTLYARILGLEERNAFQDRQIASKADKSETAALRAENEKLKKENEAIKAYLCSKDKKASICH